MSKNAVVAGKGRLVGAIILALGVTAVFVIKRERPRADAPDLVRPLKTLVIGQAGAGSTRSYPAKVGAGQQVTMAFEVGGALKVLPVMEGDQVKKGDLLAQLDDRDYRNALGAAEAEVTRTKAQLERMQQAARANAVSDQEVTNARASYEAAHAQFRIRKKAVEDTLLRASFAGRIARTYVKNFEAVGPKQPILTLQDVTTVEVVASVPESRVAEIDPRQSKAEKKKYSRFTAAFDHFPGRTFDVTVKEFSTEADPVTQTYRATFTMSAPEDVTVLPGMSAMVTEHRLRPETADDGPLLVPLDIVPVDGVGQHFVWLLEALDGGIYKLTRRDVSVGELIGDSVMITSGIKKGDRIAAAGVHVVVEDQKVRLLEQGS